MDDFLAKLNIAEECFRLPNGRWSFDEYGKDMLLDFLVNGRNEKYKSIRSLEIKEEHMEDYQNIIAQTLSNLNSNRRRVEKQKSKTKPNYFPVDRVVFYDFWSNIYDRTDENFYIFPWLTCMRECVDMFKLSDVKMIMNDILYIGGEIQESFDDLVLKYNKEREELARKWSVILSRYIEFRREEREWIIKTQKDEGVQQLHEIIDASGIMDVDEMEVGSLSEEDTYIKRKKAYKKNMKKKARAVLRGIKKNELLATTMSATKEEAYRVIVSQQKKK